MTNLHGWRLATGFPSQTRRGSPFGLLLAIALSAIPGMLGHGLFIDEIDAVYVAGKDGILHLTREAS